MGKLSLKAKLILILILAGALPSSIIAILAFNKSSEALNQEAMTKLVAVRESKAFQLEELYKLMRTQIQNLGESTLVRDSLIEFEKGVENYSSETPDVNASDIKSKLTSYYDAQFVKKYNEINNTSKKGIDYIQFLSDEQIEIQDAFISSNKFPFGEKAKLSDLENGTTYAKAHSKFHQSFKNYIEQFGYYDLFLISAKSNKVVYTVTKEIDFMADLTKGEFSNSSITQLYKKSLTTDGVHISDIEKYFPSFNAPSQFVSYPIIADGKKIGVLVFQVPVDKVNMILTGNQKWKEQGLGESGETYIVGKDHFMRSVSRFLIEDKPQYLESMKGAGLSGEQITYIDKQNTSALAVKLESSAINHVIEGKSGFEITKDYRGVDVISAYMPIKIEGLEWFMLSEFDQAEALVPVVALRNIVLVVVAVSLLIIIVGAFTVSTALSNQIIKIATRLNEGAKSVLDSSTKIAEGSTELSSTTDELAASVQETSSSVSEISAMVTRSSESADVAANRSLESREKAIRGKKSVNEVKSIIELIHKSNEDIVQGVDENNRQIEEIKAVISEISEKTKVINDIVFQTKLLSFNASVEAARAGEHGKGFSVVAEEVGNLASMSGNAANSITTLLDQSTKKVNDIVESSKAKMITIIDQAKQRVESGVSKSVECESILDDVLESFEIVNNSVNEIANSAKEQASGVNEITQAIQEIDNATQQNSIVAGESSVRAEELRGQSNVLSQIVVEMQRIVYGNKEAPLKKEQSFDKRIENEEPQFIEKKVEVKPELKVVKAKEKVKVEPKIEKPIVAEPRSSEIEVSLEIPSSDDSRFEDVG
ncbi:methyl-accepting chemotaxis protein signaling domain protein [Bacteriovorax sp. BSW11_IV]|uniref:methyl-accepting chemotaxis protein n=1 Tax=Bacteriovorax sp. BSW11_IV TaxID=1353529 RepID=UPI00038A5321|nr:methyl-accepting chemotaxis protein [Bacteriovorax sp. BSW11_IV]EQC49620.1 methyl-accepting chemotaxis protein signaling domain protein [Bacteriovorax sp. BSW11_IV]